MLPLCSCLVETQCMFCPLPASASSSGGSDNEQGMNAEGQLHPCAGVVRTCGAAVTSVGSVSLYSSVSPVVSMAVSSTSSSLPLHDSTCLSLRLHATQVVCCVFVAGMLLLRGCCARSVVKACVNNHTRAWWRTRNARGGPCCCDCSGAAAAAVPAPQLAVHAAAAPSTVSTDL